MEKARLKRFKGLCLCPPTEQDGRISSCYVTELSRAITRCFCTCSVVSVGLHTQDFLYLFSHFALLIWCQRSMAVVVCKRNEEFELVTKQLKLFEPCIR